MRWRPFLCLLGLLLLDASPLFAQTDNRADTGRNAVVVADVMPNGPAARAGIKAGDMISKIDDQDIRDYDALTRTISKHKPGDKVKLSVKQGDQSKEITVTLGSESA